MIIFAPRQQLSEPAAENGPEWSYRTPILIVCPCASARGAHVLATATASTSAVARIIRADFIDGPPRKKVVRRVSRAGPASEDHPLAPLPSARRAERVERAFDREGGGQEPAHLRRRHDEGRARRQRAQREEAGEEPAAAAQRARQRAHVLRAPRGIDRAEARVLPDAVEGVGQLAPEREDVAALEGGGHALAGRQRARLGERGGREVEARDLVAARGEQPRVVTAAAARHRHASARRRRRVEHVHERRRGAAELPAVAAARVDVLPELRRACPDEVRAYTGHRSASKYRTARARRPLRVGRLSNARATHALPVGSQARARSHAPTTTTRAATASAHCMSGRNGRSIAGAAARPRAPPSRSPNRCARRSPPGLVPRRPSRARLAAATIHGFRPARRRPRATTRVAPRMPIAPNIAVEAPTES